MPTVLAPDLDLSDFTRTQDVGEIVAAVPGLSWEHLTAGPALSELDIAEAAESLGCDVPALKAVLEVEAAGSGFRRSGWPTLKPEPHVFSRETGGAFDASHPQVSRASFAAARSLWSRNPEALFRDMNTLNAEAAMRSTSWGLGQVMGFNHALAGCESVQQLVKEARESEAKQLGHMTSFIRSTRLDGHLRAHDWARFARGYNGASFRVNDYDGKLARAYRRHAGEPSWIVISLGDSGPAVKRLQEALSRAGFECGDDGHFGPETEAALRAFQQESGLAVDGTAGARTWEALSKVRQLADKDTDTAPTPPRTPVDQTDTVLDGVRDIGGTAGALGVSLAEGPLAYIAIGLVVVAIIAFSIRMIRDARRR